MNTRDKPPLFIVFNLGAGDGDTDEARSTITDACSQAGRELHLIEVGDPRQVDALAADAVRQAQRADGVVVAAGGDGTIRAVAQAVLGSNCRFGVLPRGTFNFFSRSHGIPGDIAEAMQVLLTERAQPVQVGLVNDKVFLVNASLGLYPQALEDREGWKKQLGRSRWVAILAGFATMLRGHRNLRLRIEVGPRARALRTPTLFIGNNALQMEKLGFPEAQAIDDGALGAIALRPVGAWSLAWLSLRSALGRLAGADQIVHFSFRRLTVRPSRKLLGWRHLKVATDGEIFRLALPLEFTIATEPLMLIRPDTVAPERTKA